MCLHDRPEKCSKEKSLAFEISAIIIESSFGLFCLKCYFTTKFQHKCVTFGTISPVCSALVLYLQHI